MNEGASTARSARLYNERMKVAAVLFDFDGTLVDSYPAITASVNHVRGLRGLPALSVAEVQRHVGRGPDYLLTHAAPGGDPVADLAAYRAHHPSVLLPLTQLLPGAAPTLERLAAAGILLGLCSNKPRLFSEQLLDHLGIARHFRVVLGPEDVARLKPAPDMVLLALRRLNVPAEQALYVGDMAVDIETARGAGVAVWAVATGSDTAEAVRAARPDRLLQRLDEVGALADRPWIDT